VQSGGSLTLGGTHGLPNGTYSVLVSTNIALPLNKWTPVATNQFDPSGNFTFTNTLNPAAPGQFFILELQ
jgi:hypothetical protein